MRALYLSTVVGVECNASLLTRAMQWSSHAAHHDTGAPASSSASVAVAPDVATTVTAGHALGDGIDVFLQVHDAQRKTFLEHALALYVAAVQVAPELCVDVIPLLSAVDTSAATMQVPPVYYTKATMTADHGFTPLYRNVAVGGTFDHLHAGHKLMLSTAALFAADRLLIGVSSEGLLEHKKFKEVLQPYDLRAARALGFVRKIRQDVKVTVRQIVNVMGGADGDSSLEALVVSPETERSLPLINAARHDQHGLPPLAAIHVPHVRDAAGSTVSSTALREHELQRRHPGGM